MEIQDGAGSQFRIGLCLLGWGQTGFQALAVKYKSIEIQDPDIQTRIRLLPRQRTPIR